MIRNLIEEVALDFDDVLIRPEVSTINSRSLVNLEITYRTPWSNRIIKGIPIISANMSSVSSFRMADTLSSRHMFCALHKFYDINEINKKFEESDKKFHDHTFITFGINDKNKLNQLSFTPSLINLDVAHGGMVSFTNFVKDVRNKFPDSVIMAGNVVTKTTTYNLFKSGADIIKLGVGSGANCITRTQTGVGIPQLTAIYNALDATEWDDRILVCSDGGITKNGHFSIAFAAGAHFCMAGSMFAGHDECDMPVENGLVDHYGMSSTHAMNKHYGKKDNYRASEGRYTKIPYKGSVDKTIEEMLGGIRSACSYVGTDELQTISSFATLQRVNHTHNTTLEKFTHE